MKKNKILMLYPSIMEIEQKSDMNSFWRSEWKRVKEDILYFDSLVSCFEYNGKFYIFDRNHFN